MMTLVLYLLLLLLCGSSAARFNREDLEAAALQVLDLNYDEHLHATVPSRDSDLLASSTDSLIAAWYVVQKSAMLRSFQQDLLPQAITNISLLTLACLYIYIPATTGLWRTQTSVALRRSSCLC
jgi:dsRNA-specific ribonuclease